MKIKRLFSYFTKTEIALWCASVILVVVSFCLFDREGYISMIASLIGVTAIMLCAKGNPIGQILMIIFSTIYGIISFSCAYYGEVATYLGMTLPMATFSLVSWLRNPFGGNHAEVTVNRITKKEKMLLPLAALCVTVVFYFVLKFFGTANLLPSTLSVATSFCAAYMTFRRSPYFALIYAANDIVLIVLWGLATVRDGAYISVVVCFVVFLANDLYSFINWRRMERRQRMIRNA